MSDGPSLPPLLVGAPVTGEDPFARACTMAREGCDGGTLVYDIRPEKLCAALVVAPEVPLREAMAMLPICALGFQNALGALAPPEVSVHLTWPGGILLNGADCGGFRVAAATTMPEETPDWLVIGLEVPILLDASDPGLTPDKTALSEEGCAEIDPTRLCEAWARHTLVWLNRWSDEGNAPVHTDWTALLSGIGQTAEQGGHRGEFIGADEGFGMLIRDDDKTYLVPLSTLLEQDI